MKWKGWYSGPLSRRAYCYLVLCLVLVTTDVDVARVPASNECRATYMINSIMIGMEGTGGGSGGLECVGSHLEIVQRETPYRKSGTRKKSDGWKGIFDFISNTADAVMGVDPEQRIVLWNEAAEGLFGLKADEALGRFCYEVIGGRDEGGVPLCRSGCSNLMMGLEGYRVPPYDLLVRTKAGREVCMNVSTVLVPSQWSERCVFVHLFRVVRHQNQNEMERLVQRLLGSVAKVAVPREIDPQPSPPPSPPSIDLTRREREVLRLLASGASNKVIATKLFISPSTARNHVHSIIAKLGVHSRLEAVTLAMRNGWLRDEVTGYIAPSSPDRTDANHSRS